MTALPADVAPVQPVGVLILPHIPATAAWLQLWGTYPNRLAIISFHTINNMDETE